MDMFSGLSGRNSPDMKIIVGCVVLITGIILLVIATLAYYQLVVLSSGTLLFTIICGCLILGIATLLAPVVLRLTSRTTIAVILCLLVLPTLLLALGMRETGFQELPWGSWIIIASGCILSVLLVSLILPYFNLYLSKSPKRSLVLVSAAIIVVSSVCNIFPELLRRMVAEDILTGFFSWVLFSGYLLVLASLVFLMITGYFLISQSILHLGDCAEEK